MRKIIFFDTETNGKPVNYKAPLSEIANWPRITQLAWIQTDETGKILRRQQLFTKLDGWEIPSEEFFVKNGHTNERQQVLGIPALTALQLFLSDLLESEYLVAHNIAFDYPVFGAECIRYGLWGFDDPTVRICTMQVGTNITKIPARHGYKWPTLYELHKHLFNKGFSGAHDALADIIACKDCFFEMVKKGSIKLS